MTKTRLRQHASQKAPRTSQRSPGSLIFTAENVRLIRQGKITGALQLNGTYQPLSLRALRRRPENSPRVETVTTPTVNGRTPVMLTILKVETVALAAIRRDHALACGHRTTQELRDAFEEEHWDCLPYGSRAQDALPVQVIQFGVGDLRERPRLLAAYMTRGDYTDDPRLAARGEPEAITDIDYTRLHRQAFARDQNDRRRPLLTHSDNIARELDGLRRSMNANGLYDTAILNNVRALEKQLDRLAGKLGHIAA